MKGTKVVAARKANPDAQLFYNDYLANYRFKAQKLLTVLDRLLEKGCEIDAWAFRRITTLPRSIGKCWRERAASAL